MAKGKQKAKVDLYTRQRAQTLAALKVNVDEAIRIHGADTTIQVEVDMTKNGVRVGSITDEEIR